jgi:hypothetical protein
MVLRDQTDTLDLVPAHVFALAGVAVSLDQHQNDAHHRAQPRGTMSILEEL